MNDKPIGRILMTIATCLYGFIPPLVDFGPTTLQILSGLGMLDSMWSGRY